MDLRGRSGVWIAGAWGWVLGFLGPWLWGLNLRFESARGCIRSMRDGDVRKDWRVGE
ncbi:hypothetical protein DENSPDRAFT_834478 [Dentipellis sp. KUC8613]|nr:hypothetical protein DENSPDRAFT_834478 [Dentipellis sp. KUC8613]